MKKFASSPEAVFAASDASGISKFFRFVTMSTTTRASSSNPNNIPELNSIKSLVYGDRTKPQDDVEDEKEDFSKFFG